MSSPPNLFVDVRFLPRDLQPRHIADRAVVIFDVLRATTSITAALNAGVRSIRILPSTADTLAGRGVPRCAFMRRTAVPAAPWFRSGTAPGAFQRSLHADRDLLMSTTNGTGAILAAAGAVRIYVGALVNAAAVAGCLAQENLPVTLLCAAPTAQLRWKTSLARVP